MTIIYVCLYTVFINQCQLSIVHISVDTRLYTKVHNYIQKTIKLDKKVHNFFFIKSRKIIETHSVFCELNNFIIKINML